MRRFLSLRWRRAACGAALSLSVIACGGGAAPSARGSGSSPPAAFRVVVASPADGASAVDLDAKIRVTLSLPIDRATMNAASLSLVSVPAGTFPGAIGFVSGSGDRTLEFLHPAELSEGTTYSLFVSTSLRSTSGDSLGGLSTFVFRTEGSGGSVVPPPAFALHPTLGALSMGRRNHTATSTGDGYVLVCGGFVQGTTITDRAELFDIAAEVFVPVPKAMHEPRAGHTATQLFDGRVLLAGGYQEASPGVLNVTSGAEV